MKKNIFVHNNEIDLIAISKIIWNGKKKILLITIISFLVGFGYSYQIPKNYTNSLTINKVDDYKFRIFDNIIRLINSKQSNQSNQSTRSNQSDRSNKPYETFVVRFIEELEDYDEFLFNIKNTKKIQKEISKLTTEEKKIKLFQYAKLLDISKPKENGEYFIVNFNWHDPDEAKKILKVTLDQVSDNLKKNINNELKQFLEFEKKFLKNNDRERLDYLNEQSIIAKELNIIDNQIDNINLSQSSVSLSINTADIAYYLRGYKAIDKEIELIENRDYKNLKFIEEEINEFKDLNIELVNYNVYLMEVENLKNTKLILIISILLGLMVGFFFVLISYALKFQTASKK